MKKRLIALALSILLLLSGCGENTYAKEKIEVKLSPYEIPAAAPQWATLYYPSPDNTSLLALSQQISGESSLYDNMMSALLNGTEEGYISPFPSGVLSRSIMLVEDILYLDMSWQMLEMELPQFLACVATLVYTYTALPEVSFVNITVEGKQLTLPTDKSTPIMLLSHYNGSLSALTSEYGNDAAPIKRLTLISVMVQLPPQE